MAINDLRFSITTLTNQQSLTLLTTPTKNLTTNHFTSTTHPPTHILRELPKSINNRIDTLPCNKRTFYQSPPTYNDALLKSNFKVQHKYEQNNTSKRHNGQRNVLWYNPSYSKNFKTNLAHNVLQLIDKHFPPLNKLFNRHTVRVSYSWNENMQTFISRDKKTIPKN